jgi:hypothetical protein
MAENRAFQGERGLTFFINCKIPRQGRAGTLLAAIHLPFSPTVTTYVVE